jgi:tetratricopeptide (TPR) repeat protein
MPRTKLGSGSSGERNTAAWVAGDIKPTDSIAAMPQGPSYGGQKLAAIPDEPAFGGRVHAHMDERSFDTGKVRMPEDDDFLPSRRGSRAGLWIAILSVLVIAAAASTTYLFVYKNRPQRAAKTIDAPTVSKVVAVPVDAAVQVTPLIDAAPPVSPIDAARGELATDIEAKLRVAGDGIASTETPTALAVRARLATALAQALEDRAGLSDKPDSDKLRKDAKQLVLAAAPLAQRAVKTAAEDPEANLAMADVLRLQSKPARDVRRYLDAARAKQTDDKDLGRSIALCDAQLLQRDGKLDDAARALAAIDGNDTRVELAVALVALAQNRGPDARPIVQQVLVASPDQEVAHALDAKLATLVAKTDPLPPEDGRSAGNRAHSGGTTPSGGGDAYDGLVERANKLAETNCGAATQVYQKALDQRSNGVEALTGMGYCYLDAKRFSSALSNFRAALLVSPRYEPALAGIAEMYQQQGNHDQAVARWKEYLDIFPNSPKAKRQLEILGATDTGATAPTPPAPGPAPAPTPTPGATPAPSAPAPTAAPTPPAPATPPSSAPTQASGSGSN